MDTFLSWAISHGANISPLLCFEQGLIGITAFTVAPVPDKHELVTCPFNLAITIDTARKYLVPCSLEPHILLRTFLVLEKLKGKESNWAPYIDLLPTQFDTPLYFDQQEQRALRGTNLYAEIVNRYDGWKAEFEAAKEIFSQETQFTWENYLWAASVFTSRSFPGTILKNHDDGGECLPVLLPVVDMLNHRPKSPIWWFTDFEKHKVCLLSGIDLEYGAQVFNNYGPKGNEELLMGYGFCIENNPFDSVVLASPTLKSNFPDETVAAKNNYLALNNHKWTKIQYLTHEIPFPEGLKMYWRILVANREEFDRIQQSPTEIGQDSLPGGLRNELNMLKHVQNALNLKLKTLLKYQLTESSSRRMKWVKMYRDGQISVLSKALDEIETLRLNAVRSVGKKGNDVSFEEALKSIAVTPENAWYANKTVKDAVDNLFKEPDIRLYVWLAYQKLYWPHLDTTNNLINTYSWEAALEWADEHVQHIFEYVHTAFDEQYPNIFGSELTKEIFTWAAFIVENKGFEWVDLDSGETKMVLIL